MTVSNVKNIEDYKPLEQIICERLGCDKIALVTYDGDNVMTWVSDATVDIELVYMIQSLKDRRNLTWMEANELN